MIFHMKSLTLFTLVCMLASSLWADSAKTVFISPNGRYGVRIGKDDSGMKTFTLVRVKTGEVLGELDTLGNSYSTDFRLLWAPDSQRAASFSPDRRGGWTHLFVREGAGFREIELPEMPELKSDSRAEAKTVTAARVPVRWAKVNVLLIDHEVADEDGISAKQRVLLTFDDKNEIKVTVAKR
jgi:hypothetical protein